MDLPVVNHEDYFAKIGDDHKFPINKFGELAKYLIDKKIVKKFHQPYACSEETLKRAHSEKYIKDVKNKTLDQKIIKKIGFPLVDSVIQRSLIATGGTAEAAAKLIEMSESKISAFIFVINLFDLGGSDNLQKKGYNVECLIDFPGH